MSDNMNKGNTTSITSAEAPTTVPQQPAPLYIPPHRRAEQQAPGAATPAEAPGQNVAAADAPGDVFYYYPFPPLPQPPAEAAHMPAANVCHYYPFPPVPTSDADVWFYYPLPRAGQSDAPLPATDFRFRFVCVYPGCEERLHEAGNILEHMLSAHGMRF